ncbi:MAG: hypothetical protein ACO1SV_12780 [Fimbriimonas sp.]
MGSDKAYGTGKPYRGLAVAGLSLWAGAAFAADPVRAYMAPDGSVRLWLRKAPSVTATEQAGWQLTPKAAETNGTWLQRLKQIYPEEAGSPWKGLLEDVRATVARDGVVMVRPSGTLTIGPVEGDRVRVAASGTSGAAEATFVQRAGGWSSPDVAKLEAWLGKTVTGVKPTSALYRFAAAVPPANASVADAWSAFMAVAARGTTTRPLILEGDLPVVIETKPSAPPAPTTGTPKPTTAPEKAAPESKEKPGDSPPWIPIGLAALVGIGLGYGLRALQKPPQAKAPDGAALQERLARSAAEAERLAADLERSKAALQESNRAAKQYRDEHTAWVRDRDETVRALQEERAAHGISSARASELAGLLKATEDAKNRTEGEMARQIQALQGKVQSQEGRAAALATKARAYAGLHREVMDAFNFLQGEIGRPEVAAVVGYLLNYSIANLLDTLLAPNPALERAMLSNVARIAGCVSNLPHVRKVAATAEGLLATLGTGAIAESASPHPYATHIGGLLRIVRNQMNVEVAPFYVAIDGEGKAHAVYI